MANEPRNPPIANQRSPVASGVLLAAAAAGGISTFTTWMVVIHPGNWSIWINAAITFVISFLAILFGISVNGENDISLKPNEHSRDIVSRPLTKSTGFWGAAGRIQYLDERIVSSETNAKTLRGRVCFVAGSRASEFQRNGTTELTSAGYLCSISNNLGIALADVAENPTEWNFMIVDLDACKTSADLSDIVSDLMIFRDTSPNIPVIIASRDFLRDDSSEHRLAISDCSLRLPMAEGGLMSILPEAVKNNATWQARQGSGAANIP